MLERNLSPSKGQPQAACRQNTVSSLKEPKNIMAEVTSYTTWQLFSDIYNCDSYISHRPTGLDTSSTGRTKRWHQRCFSDEMIILQSHMIYPHNHSKNSVGFKAKLSIYSPTLSTSLSNPVPQSGYNRMDAKWSTRSTLHTYLSLFSHPTAETHLNASTSKWHLSPEHSPLWTVNCMWITELRYTSANIFTILMPVPQLAKKDIRHFSAWKSKALGNVGYIC